MPNETPTLTIDLRDAPSPAVRPAGEGGPPAALTAELAWCLRRFATGRADESAMRRAERALTEWEAWMSRPRVESGG